jgi:hypothetical protein
MALPFFTRGRYRISVGGQQLQNGLWIPVATVTWEEGNVMHFANREYEGVFNTEAHASDAAREQAMADPGFGALH